LNLGDTSLENVTIETAGVDYMANYAPPNTEPDARKEQDRVREFKVNEFTYKDRVPAETGKTYVVPSVNYSKQTL
jgi:hypothetical protein